MKVLIAFFICIVAVSGSKFFASNENAEIEKLVNNASNACVREMNRNERFIIDKGFPDDPCLTKDPSFLACLYTKIGVLKEDGTYNLEHAKTWAKTPERKKEIEDLYNAKIKECESKSGNDGCKLVACWHKLVDYVCTAKQPRDFGEC